MTDPINLKACPFCGGAAIRCGNNDINPRHWIMCQDCHACPGGDVPDLAAAETAWNRRAALTAQKEIQPVAWLRHGENVPVRQVPFGAMWISDKDDQRAFPVYANAPEAIEAIAIIEARLPLYTDIGQINALRECISSIRSAALSAEQAQPVAVKPLKWSTQTRQGWTVHVAKGLGCTYEASAKVWNNGWMWGRVEDDSNFDAEDEETAKAAAQSDYEARIRSALSVPLPEIEGGDKGDGWQPIETAPKNKYVLLFRPNAPLWQQVTEGKWDDQGHHKKPRPFWACPWRIASNDGDRDHAPTHWRPLPAAPSASIEGETP